jgi:hypothetical protein
MLDEGAENHECTTSDYIRRLLREDAKRQAKR